jgi:hypothetical protein
MLYATPCGPERPRQFEWMESLQGVLRDHDAKE